MRHTVRINIRRTWTGKLVLQVEEEVKARWPASRSAPTRRRWRNADVMDLTKHELRALVDLRSKPQFAAPSFGAPEDAPQTLMEDFAVAPGLEAARTDGRISKH